MESVCVPVKTAPPSCPLGAGLRFMSVETVFSSQAKRLSSLQETGFSYAKCVVLLLCFCLPAQAMLTKVIGQRPDYCTPSNTTLLWLPFLTHTHTCRRPENIPQQQRTRQHEHPEETTLTSWQIKPSRRLLGVITAISGWPLSGWGRAPP